MNPTDTATAVAFKIRRQVKHGARAFFPLAPTAYFTVEIRGSIDPWSDKIGRTRTFATENDARRAFLRTFEGAQECIPVIEPWIRRARKA